MIFYIVDAFAEKPYGGNTAGVVLIKDGYDFPEDRWMLKIAAELRFSETAFVRQDPDGNFTTRYFTPRYEVDLCGHATIAAFGLMWEEDIVPGGETFINHTAAGDLKVIPGSTVMMQMAAPRLVGTIEDTPTIDCLLKAMRMIPGVLLPLPIEIISTGLPDILLPVSDPSSLFCLNPDMDALSKLSESLGVVGVHAFAPVLPTWKTDAEATSDLYERFLKVGISAYKYVFGAGSPISVRNFAPLYGIPEEPATGTANAALTYYLYRNGLMVDGSGRTFEQGNAMGRPSIVETRLDIVDGQPDIWVGGPCAIVAKGELL